MSEANSNRLRFLQSLSFGDDFPTEGNQKQARLSAYTCLCGGQQPCCRDAGRCGLVAVYGWQRYKTGRFNVPKAPLFAHIAHHPFGGYENLGN